MLRKRILVITARADFGGGPEHVYQLIRNIGGDAEFFVGCPKDFPYWQKYAHIIGENNISVIPHRRLSLAALARLYRTMRRKKVNLIHSHGKGAGVYGRILGALTRTSCVHTFHGVHVKNAKSPAAKLYFLIEKFLSFFTDTIIAVSESEAEIITANGISPAGKVIVIENGVEISVHKVDERNFQTHPRTISAITRNDYVKNPVLLFEIAALLSAHSNDFVINLIGTGFSETDLVAPVNHVGPVSGTGSQLLKSFCFISTSLREGLPLGVMEAMARGVPVIATDVPGHRDLIKHGCNGFLFPVDSPEKAINCIINVSNDYKQWKLISDNAKQTINQKYSVVKMAGKISAVYSSVINKRLAIVQDWLTGMRGGEKVLEKICGMFPDAPLFTMIHVPGSVSPDIENRTIKTSLLQKLPLGVSRYRYYLPLLPLLVKTLKTNEYDLVISTSHCVAKNVKARKGGLHICYCHTPMRYIWDMFSHYFSLRENPPLYLLMRLFRPYLRSADTRAARNVDYFIANSNTTAERIKKYYGRESVVMYPPVDTNYYTPADIAREDFYLIVSSLVPYKRVDIAVEAFNKSGRRLKIIGSGPESEKLKASAADNIEFHDWRGQDFLRENYRQCRALIFPGKEDFGIVPVEAMACGTPVIAYSEGGSTETVINGETGLFFDEQLPECLNESINLFEAMEFDTDNIKRRAGEFSEEIFLRRFKGYVGRARSEKERQD